MQSGTAAVVNNMTSDRRMKTDVPDTRDGVQKPMLLPVRDFALAAKILPHHCP